MKVNVNTSVRLEIEELRQRLQEAEETLEAIRSGAVDALVVNGPGGEKVFTLEGADRPYRVLVETISEGAVSLSFDGAILYSNGAFARMAEVPLDQVMGREMVQFLSPEDRDAFDTLIRSARTGEMRAEMTILSTSGRALPVQFSLNPIDSQEDGAIAVVITDLSERKRNEAAEAAVRVRDDLLAIAGHELRTPLGALSLNMAVLEGEARSGEMRQMQNGLRQAEKQIQRMSRLVDRLLDISQITSGRTRLDLTEFELGELLKEVADRTLAEASRSGCELRVSADDEVVGLWDRFRLDEAFTNLLANAIKFGAGGPVDVQLRLVNKKAVVVVQDRGIGVSPEDLDRVFGRFERSTAGKNYSGLGLGLYITREIIEQHDGAIRAENRTRGGARFIVELPLNISQASQGSRVSTSEKTQGNQQAT
jgi:PAS domain S-box-containing protein